jgi:hypothetical protein
MEQGNNQQQEGVLERAILALVSHRMSLWLWVSVALLVAIFFLARHMIGVALFKLALMTIAMYVGYAGSLAIEGALGFGKRRMRPHEYQAEAAQLRADHGNADPRAWELDQIAAWMLLRRTIIVAAALLASALGG